MTEAQLLLLRKLGEGRDISYSQDGDVAWLSGDDAGNLLNDADIAALRGAGYLQPMSEYRFNWDVISPIGLAALTSLPASRPTAEGGGHG